MELYSKFLKASEIKYEAGESNYMEKVIAETKLMEIENESSKISSEIKIIQDKLNMYINDHCYFMDKYSYVS